MMFDSQLVHKNGIGVLIVVPLEWIDLIGAMDELKEANGKVPKLSRKGNKAILGWSTLIQNYLN